VKPPIIALAAALAASPALAAQDYPPGLFENSPVVPSGPPGAAVPSESPGAAVPIGPPDAEVPSEPADPAVPLPPAAVGPPDDYCASVAFRTFRNLAEVRRAHARCDPPQRAAPLSPPFADQPE
jgi:hypothetical protein